MKLARLFSVVFSILMVCSLSAQETKKEAKIKMIIINDDGTKTVIDTTFDGDIPEDFQLYFKGDSTIKKDVMIKTLDCIQDGELKFITDSTSTKKIKIIECTGDTGTKKMHVFISSDGDVIKTDQDDLQNFENIEINKESVDGTIRYEVTISDDGNKTVDVWIDGDSIDVQNGDKKYEVKCIKIGEDGETFIIDGDNEIKVISHESSNENISIIKVKCIILETDDEDKSILTKIKPDLKENNELEISDLVISPNPNSGEFNITGTLKNTGGLNLLICDVNGKEILNRSINSDINQLNEDIKLNPLESGLYFIILEQEGRNLVKKVLIK